MKRAVVARASDHEPEQQPGSSSGIPAGLLLFVGAAAYTATSLRDQLSDVLYADDDALSDLALAGLGAGDLFGALLWSVAFWYISPLQLLLVFLGRFETERPSDWIMQRLGRAAQLDVEAIDYAAPAWVRAVAASACGAGGLATAALLGSGLGDATWAVSSGLGALFAAAIFELGRPKRLSVAEAQTLEAQWQDFAAFAERSLQRSGRCHESEVFGLFRQRYSKYRSAEVLSDASLRDMVRNWHPGVERTRTGYLRNVSLVRSAPPSPAASSSSPISSMDGAAASSGSALLDSIAAEAAAEQTQQAQQKQAQQQTQVLSQAGSEARK